VLDLRLIPPRSDRDLPYAGTDETAARDGLTAGILACTPFRESPNAGAGPSDGGSAEAGAEAALADAGAEAGVAPGNTARDFALAQQNPTAIVLDEANVYWINEGTKPNKGSLMRFPKSGSVADLATVVGLRPILGRGIFDPELRHHDAERAGALDREGGERPFGARGQRERSALDGRR
jgi:hypothetical protein